MVVKVDLCLCESASMCCCLCLCVCKSVCVCVIMSAWNSVIPYVHLMWKSTAVWGRVSTLVFVCDCLYMNICVILHMPEDMCFRVCPGYRECSCVHIWVWVLYMCVSSSKYTRLQGGKSKWSWNVSCIEGWCWPSSYQSLLPDGNSENCRWDRQGGKEMIGQKHKGRKEKSQTRGRSFEAI